MLNTITGENCVQSVFPYCKLQQSEVTKKQLRTLNNIETNKINKKRKTLMICYTEIKVFSVNILLLTLISSSAFNTEELM